MSPSVQSQITAYEKCRKLLRAAVRSNSDELDFKAFDKELNQLYDSILNAQPQNRTEAKLLVTFLLDQLAYFNDLGTEQPEIQAIKTAVDLFMTDT